MNLKYLLLVCLVALFAYLFKIDLSCNNYNGDFHYSSHVVSFHLSELTSTETHVPIFVARFFHNKVSVMLFDIFFRYTQYFNIFYLINTLGIIGLFGLLYFYFFLFGNIKVGKLLKVFGIILLLLPFAEIFQAIKLFPFKMFAFILPYQGAAFVGILYFLKQKSLIKYSIYLLLLLLTIGWIVVFKNDLMSFCTTS